MPQPELPFAPFRNEGLFAEHYLLDVLRVQAHPHEAQPFLLRVRRVGRRSG